MSVISQFFDAQRTAVVLLYILNHAVNHAILRAELFMCAFLKIGEQQTQKLILQLLMHQIRSVEMIVKHAKDAPDVAGIVFQNKRITDVEIGLDLNTKVNYFLPLVQINKFMVFDV